jgi:hypothetical protein
MHAPKSPFTILRHALAGGVAALLVGASPAMLSAAEPAAAPGFEPTMKDYLSVYDALQHYRLGVEKHDQAMQDSAFWEAPKRGAPPPGFAPPPGAGGAPGAPPNWEEIRKMPGFVEVWHLPLDSYIHFESATRATHYEYFLSIYPQPEKNVDDKGAQPNASSSRVSIVGWPGHYDDVLEKRNGEWRILTRKTMINEK